MTGSRPGSHRITRPFHDNACRRVKATTSFVPHHGPERGRELRRRDDMKSEPFVERLVPGDISEGGQCHRVVPRRSGPTTHVHDEPRPEPAASVRGKYIDFFEMCGTGV